MLKQFGVNASPTQLVNRWAATVALDHAIDDGRLNGSANPDDYTSDELNASINFDNPQGYNSPGAPPNGSDYVRLRNGRGFLKAGAVRSISFKGSTVGAVRPAGVGGRRHAAHGHRGRHRVREHPGRCRSGCSLQRLWSRPRPVDVRSVSVPASGGQLSFDTLFDTEEAWDFGYVQVSTDGGRTWQSLSTEDTTTAHDPDALALAVQNLPGFPVTPARGEPSTRTSAPTRARTSCSGSATSPTPR